MGHTRYIEKPSNLKEFLTTVGRAINDMLIAGHVQRSRRWRSHLVEQVTQEPATLSQSIKLAKKLLLRTVPGFPASLKIFANCQKLRRAHLCSKQIAKRCSGSVAMRVSSGKGVDSSAKSSCPARC
jgi:hypothetical protein